MAGELRVDTIKNNSGLGTITIANSGLSVSGIVSDNIGNLRTLGITNQSSAYVLTANDVGKVIGITTGGVTVPSNVFTSGQSVVIFNNSGFAQTITQGTSATMYFAGVGSTGNRSLSLYGLASIICTSNNTFVISGTGLV